MTECIVFYRLCEQEIKHCEDVLRTISTDDVVSRETQRRIDAVKRQRQNKVNELTFNRELSQ